MTKYRTIVSTIWCDAGNCNHSFETTEVKPGVRREAAILGWRYVVARDFCPEHARPGERGQK